MTGVVSVFDALAADGQAGQAAEQGGNYYLDDPVERRNLMEFVRRLRLRAERSGRRVLVAGCGEGLDSAVLDAYGFDVTGFDLSPNAVEVARRQVPAGTFYVGDVTDPMTWPPGSYGGVVLAQVAQFIPGDLWKPISSLVGRTLDGLLYLSTTYYDDPQHVRRWVLNGKDYGATVYHARPFACVAGLVCAAGMKIGHADHFDAGPGDYKNDYLIASR